VPVDVTWLVGARHVLCMDRGDAEAVVERACSDAGVLLGLTLKVKPGSLVAFWSEGSVMYSARVVRSG
jgi:hypothetical protein